MKVVVVYGSLWGNTAAVARAIAEGIGPEAQVLSTAEATGAPIADADLSHPSMRSSLDALPPGHGREAAFDTRVRGPFGSAAPKIAERLERAGYRVLGKPQGFIVKGKPGPLRDGELERAREWGEALARLMP